MKIENLTQEQKNLLNEITTSKTYIRKSDLTSGNAYKITLTRKRQEYIKVSFVFHDNFKNASDKNDFIYSLLRDGQAYEFCFNLADFMNEFDYTDDTQAKKIYNACKKQSDRLHKLFNSTEIEILGKVFENY